MKKSTIGGVVLVLVAGCNGTSGGPDARGDGSTDATRADTPAVDVVGDRANGDGTIALEGGPTDAAHDSAADGIAAPDGGDGAANDDVVTVADGGADAEPSDFTASAFPCGTFALDTTLPAGVIQMVDLGHVGPLINHRTSGNRILGRDATFGSSTTGTSIGQAHWVLWDTDHGGQIAAGIQPCTPFLGGCGGMSAMPFADLRGQTLVIGSTTNVTVRSVSDGHVVTTIPMATPNRMGPYGLAYDGSYFWGATSSALTVWSTTTGSMIFMRAGSYTSANIFAAPTELRVATGPAGANVIEHLDATTGASTVTAAFAGTFLKWFLDGSHFISTASSTVRIYAPDATMNEIAALPAVPVDGLGGYFWTNPSSLSLYQVGSSTAVAVYAGANYIGAEHDLLAMQSTADATMHIVQLAPTGPVDTTYPMPAPGFAAGSFSADATDHWSLGAGLGLLYDEPAITGSGPPRSLSCGDASDVSGSPSGAAAVATQAGIVVLDLQPAAQTVVGSFARSVGSTQWSTDGSILVAGTTYNGGTFASTVGPDRSLYEYAMPSGALTGTIPYTFGAPGTAMALFSLAGSGSKLAQLIGTYDASRNLSYAREITDLANTVLFTDPTPPMVPETPVPSIFSPSGAYVTLTGASTGTQIYNGTALVGAASSIIPVAWVDETRFIARQYAGTTYQSTALFNTSGTLISTVPGLREPDSLREAFAPPNGIYSEGLSQHQIYDLASGAVTWTSAVSGLSGLWRTAVAGNFVVTQVGHSIVVESR